VSYGTAVLRSFPERATQGEDGKAHDSYNNEKRPITEVVLPSYTDNENGCSFRSFEVKPDLIGLLLLFADYY
jgi:hypothetical protein